MPNTTITETTLAKTKEKRAYIGGYIAAELVAEVEKIAREEARGNRSLVLERFLREALEHHRACGCKPPTEVEP